MPFWKVLWEKKYRNPDFGNIYHMTGYSKYIKITNIEYYKYDIVNWDFTIPIFSILFWPFTLPYFGIKFILRNVFELSIKIVLFILSFVKRMILFVFNKIEKIALRIVNGPEIKEKDIDEAMSDYRKIVLK